MRPRIRLWLALFLLAMAPGGQAAEGGGDPSSLADAESFCARRLSAVGGLSKQSDDLLNELRAEMAKGLQGKTGSPSDANTGGAKTSEKPSIVPMTPEQEERVTVAIGLAQDLLEASKSLTQSADKALAEAKRASNPVMKQMYVKEAMAKLDNVEGIHRRLDDLLPTSRGAETAASSGGGSKSGGGVTMGDSPTLRLLKAMAERAPGDPAAGWANVVSVRGSPPEAAMAAPRSNTQARFFSIAPAVTAYDPTQDRLTTADGGSISVAPLRKALATAAPEIRDVVAFIPSPNQPGKVEPAPVIADVIADPAKRLALEKVGGVALAVIFDLLGRSGQPAFRGEGALVALRDPVLISLAKLYQRLQPYAKDGASWARLPDEVRYPGGIGRIYGFVLDPKGRDIVLIGTGAETVATRQDIDVLILALRSVWRRDGVPAVSLDPIPQSMGGPQYSRVIDLPRDSIMARTMLDADYAMKRVLFGDLVVPKAHLKPLIDLYAEAPSTSETIRNRYWFTPAPLRAGNLDLSVSGRTVLLSSGLQVLTEGQRLADGALVDSGARDPIAQRAVDAFNQALPILETATELRPAGIFQNLHGLIDAVTLAKLWREMGVSGTLLRSIADLPYRSLGGNEAAPAFYPGIVRERQIPEAGGTRRLVHSGGISLISRPLLSSLSRRDDAPLLRLEASADQLLAGHDWLGRHKGTVLLVGSQAKPPTAADESLRQASFALADGKPEAARGLLVTLSRAEPWNAEAWGRLAKVESLVGHHGEARRLIQRALLLEPGDSLMRNLAFEVEWQADRAKASAGNPEARLKVGKAYGSAALAAAIEGRTKEAAKLAGEALAFDDDNGDAYLARAWSHGNDPQAERLDIVRALRAYRRQAREDKSFENKGGLALALSIGAIERLLRLVPPPKAVGLQREATLQQLLDETGRATDEAKEAAGMAPDFPLAPAVELWGRAERLIWLKAAGRDTDAGAANRALDSAMQRFPDFAFIHFARAKLAQAQDRPDEAETALNEALRREPTFALAYRARAELRVDMKRCAEARADAEQAKSLGIVLDDTLSQTLANCH